MVNRVLGFSKGMFFSFKRFMLLGWSNKAVGKSRAEIAVCTSHPLVMELQFAHHPIFFPRSSWWIGFNVWSALWSWSSAVIALNPARVVPFERLPSFVLQESLLPICLFTQTTTLWVYTQQLTFFISPQISPPQGGNWVWSQKNQSVTRMWGSDTP